MAPRYQGILLPLRVAQDTLILKHFICVYLKFRSFPGGAVVENPPASAGNTRDMG